MLSDDLMTFFVGFLLDFDYGFNWKEVLRKAGWDVREADWERYVEEYNRSLPRQDRPAPPEVEIPLTGPIKDDLTEEAKTALEKWEARMKLKERTVRPIDVLARRLCSSFLAIRAPCISWPSRY